MNQSRNWLLALGNVATCDFAAITDPLDKALRTRFICSINNEAVLKALFKINADDLNFTCAIEVTTKTEDAAKVAERTVFGSFSEGVHKVRSFKNINKKSAISNSSQEKDKGKCYRCGKSGHLALDCRFKDATCNYCNN